MVAIAFANAPRLAGRSLIRKKHLRSRQLSCLLKAAIAQFVRSGKLSSFRLSPNYEEFVWQLYLLKILN
jgi:hypothetical protein